MLIEFSFGNFRSFKETATLSLVAASKLQSDPELDSRNIFSVPNHTQLSLLRVAALYGANASGKSNVIRAFSAFRQAVIQSANNDFVFSAAPFLLDASSQSSPTAFEVIFMLAGAQYRYGFAMTLGKEQRITAEWLFRATSTREALLFERSENIIERGRTFTEGTSLIKDKRLKRQEALFLSLAAQLGEDIAASLVNCIQKNFRVVSGLQDRGLRRYTESCLENGQHEEFIQALIRDTDTGIATLGLAEDDEADSPPQLPDAQPTERNEAMHKQHESMVRSLQNRTRIVTEHDVFNAEKQNVGSIAFPMSTESEGTQKLIAFAGPLADTLAKGTVLFIDEMDARFHPLMTKALIRLFQSPETNPKNAQLIFVTHDTNLLDRRSFRRDQIWFVEKDAYGASHLYSLAEFKGVRKDASFEADYIAGRYGAIPLLGDLSRLIAADEISNKAEKATDHAKT